jgi:hypothetical protein
LSHQLGSKGGEPSSHLSLIDLEPGEERFSLVDLFEQIRFPWKRLALSPHASPPYHRHPAFEDHF